MNNSFEELNNELCNEFIDNLTDDIINDVNIDIVAELYRQSFYDYDESLSDKEVVKRGLVKDQIQFFLKEDKINVIISCGDWCQSPIDSNWFKTILIKNLSIFDVDENINIEIEPEYQPPCRDDYDDDFQPNEFDLEEINERGYYNFINRFY